MVLAIPRGVLHFGNNYLLNTITEIHVLMIYYKYKIDVNLNRNYLQLFFNYFISPQWIYYSFSFNSSKNYHITTSYNLYKRGVLRVGRPALMLLISKLWWTKKLCEDTAETVMKNVIMKIEGKPVTHFKDTSTYKTSNKNTNFQNLFWKNQIRKPLILYLWRCVESTKAIPLIVTEKLPHKKVQPKTSTAKK